MIKSIYDFAEIVKEDETLRGYYSLVNNPF